MVHKLQFKFELINSYSNIKNSNLANISPTKKAKQTISLISKVSLFPNNLNEWNCARQWQIRSNGACGATRTPVQTKANTVTIRIIVPSHWIRRPIHEADLFNQNGKLSTWIRKLTQWNWENHCFIHEYDFFIRIWLISRGPINGLKSITMVRAHADGAAPSMLFPAAFLHSISPSLSAHTQRYLPGVWRVARQITILQLLDKTTPMQLLYHLLVSLRLA